MVDQCVFEDFAEYWYYMKHLSEYQRKIIFDNLSKEQQKKIESSYDYGQWSDLFYRNEINKILDDMKEKYGYDVLEIRGKALKGKSVYVPARFWLLVLEYMKQYRKEDTRFVLSGIKAIECKENKDVVLIVSASSNVIE